MYIGFLDLFVSGFESSTYTVSEEEGSISLCANLASPAIQRSSIVSFQTSSISQSADGKTKSFHRSTHCV